jgi:hypothetical protein
MSPTAEQYDAFEQQVNLYLNTQLDWVEIVYTALHHGFLSSRTERMVFLTLSMKAQDRIRKRMRRRSLLSEVEVQHCRNGVSEG